MASFELEPIANYHRRQSRHAVVPPSFVVRMVCDPEVRSWLVDAQTFGDFRHLATVWTTKEKNDMVVVWSTMLLEKGGLVLDPVQLERNWQKDL